MSQPSLLLIGNIGQVGWELRRTLAPLGRLISVDFPEIDLTNPDSIREWVRESSPGVIINAAAYTAVDKAETEPDRCNLINGTAPGILAEEAKKLGSLLVHYSTDYVFDGRKTTPYTENDPTGPLNVYGKSKLAGEQAIQAAGVPHLIFRTSWVYSTGGKNFLLTILRLASEREELRIVNDQIGCPNWSRCLAEATLGVINRISAQGGVPFLNKLSGIYHMSGTGQTTWCEFAVMILQNVTNQLEVSDTPSVFKAKRVIPISTSEFPTRAKRPAYSVLDNRKLFEEFGITLPMWSIQLSDACEMPELARAAVYKSR